MENTKETNKKQAKGSLELLNSKEWREYLRKQIESWPEWKRNAGIFYPIKDLDIYG